MNKIQSLKNKLVVWSFNTIGAGSVSSITPSMSWFLGMFICFIISIIFVIHTMLSLNKAKVSKI